METPWKTTLAILAASMTMGSLVLFIILVHINNARKVLRESNKLKAYENEMQNSLLKNSIEIEEREKERIYRNFHDQVNPMIRFVMRRLEMHRIELTKKTLKVDSLNEDIEMLLKALEGIKACTYELVPTFLIEAGLIKSLEYVLQKLNSKAGIRTSSSIDITSQRNLNFSHQEELNIYRIILEKINNILQHSGCKEVTMKIWNSEGNLVIQLKHDGRGMSNTQVERLTKEGSGTGLRSCKARALLLNASIDYTFSPFSSTVLIKVPYIK